MEQIPSKFSLQTLASNIRAVAIFVALNLQNTIFKYFQELTPLRLFMHTASRSSAIFIKQKIQKHLQAVVILFNCSIS
jgi:hypothetical protein